jgi:hypothetical protein
MYISLFGYLVGEAFIKGFGPLLYQIVFNVNNKKTGTYESACLPKRNNNKSE